MNRDISIPCQINTVINKSPILFKIWIMIAYLYDIYCKKKLFLKRFLKYELLNFDQKAGQIDTKLFVCS